MIVDFKTIGKRIKATRTQQRMTQADLAERTGFSNVYISYIEAGEKRASLDALLRIANELDLSLDSLVFDGTPGRPLGICHEFTELLADCDVDEREQILKTASAHKKMLRIEKR